MENTKILFISRAYPPIMGGIENQNYALSIWLPKHAEVKTIANIRGKIFLPFFLPWATLRALWLMRQYDALLLGDGVLSCLGWTVKLFHSKPVISVLHGLDLTFRNSLYQKIWVNLFLPKLDKFICVGNETLRVAKEKGLAGHKLVFIPNGVDPAELCEPHTRAELGELLGLPLEGKKVIARVGRYVRHKGVEWFIQNVMHRLPEHYILVAAGAVVASKTAGDENMYPACQKAIQENSLEGRVKLLTNLPWKKMKVLFNTADLFISPNIKVEGTMEGFGINAIEAAVCSRVVVASRLEGLQDAIKDAQNGFLVTPGEPQGFIDKITSLLENETFCNEFGEKARQFTLEHYSWEKIAKQYVNEIRKITSNG